MRPEKIDWWLAAGFVILCFIVLVLYRELFSVPLEVGFSTINRSLSSVGPRQMPTRTPLSLSMPVGTPPAFMRAGDFGILSQEPCGPPCFRDIRPGVTSFSDATLLLQNAGVPCTVSDITQGTVLKCGSSDISISVATVGLCTAASTSPMVGGIGLAPPDKITVGEFIARYGPPDLLILGGPQVLLPYERMQTVVDIGVQLAQPSYTVTASTTINQFIYVTAADYSTCLQQLQRDVQPWKGYGTYNRMP